MTPKVLFLQPVDGWSFRDGRPFDAGEAFEAGSLYPPPPWTTAGCVRTALLRRLCGDPERYAGRGSGRTCPKCGDGPCAAVTEVGPAGQSAPFAVGPPLPARRVADGRFELYFPAPQDLAEDDADAAVGCLLKPVAVPSGTCHSLGTVGLAPVGAEAPKGRLKPWPRRWLTAAQLETCLDGGVPDSGGEPPTIERDPRVGVGIEPGRRSVKEGLLYVREFVSLGDGEGLAVTLERELGLAGETGRLGGDGRMSVLDEGRAVAWPAAPPATSRRIKVVFAAPTLFEGGWRPGFLDPKSLEGDLGGARVRLVGAALAPAAPVGGWDLAKQQPRPLRQLVGAGSVYFFGLTGGEPAAVIAAVHGRSLCDDSSMAKVGFGLAFVGRY